MKSDFTAALLPDRWLFWCQSTGLKKSNIKYYRGGAKYTSVQTFRWTGSVLSLLHRDKTGLVRFALLRLQTDAEFSGRNRAKAASRVSPFRLKHIILTFACVRLNSEPGRLVTLNPSETQNHRMNRFTSLFWEVKKKNTHHRSKT